MPFLPGLCVILLGLCCTTVPLLADDEKSKNTKPAGTITPLATLQGEIVKVSDGGWKIEVKYKDIVPYSTRSTLTSTQGAVAHPQFRLPPLHLTNAKEKNQELELRLLESSKVRFIPLTKEENKGKKSVEAAKKDVKAEEKSAPESNTTTKKSEKKTKEPTLPGKPGEPSQLAKGQIVNVTVAREDFPNFSRYVATVVLVVGEK